MATNLWQKNQLLSLPNGKNISRLAKSHFSRGGMLPRQF